MSASAASASAAQSLVSPQIASSQRSFDVPLRLGIMASGNGSNLESIAQAIADGQLHAQIEVLIYNKPDIKAAERADRWNIPKHLLNHKDFPSREALDEAIVSLLRQYQVDWVIMAGWMRIVTPVLIQAFPHRILNIHPSLLPSFPGVHAVEQALAAGVKIAGCTVHYVIPAVDSGAIIMQAAVPVFEDDTADTLHQRIQEQEHLIYPKAIELAALRS